MMSKRKRQKISSPSPSLPSPVSEEDLFLSDSPSTFSSPLFWEDQTIQESLLFDSPSWEWPGESPFDFSSDSSSSSSPSLNSPSFTPNRQLPTSPSYESSSLSSSSLSSSPYSPSFCSTQTNNQNLPSPLSEESPSSSSPISPSFTPNRQLPTSPSYESSSPPSSSFYSPSFSPTQLDHPIPPSPHSRTPSSFSSEPPSHSAPPSFHPTQTNRQTSPSQQTIRIDETNQTPSPPSSSLHSQQQQQFLPSQSHPLSSLAFPQDPSNCLILSGACGPNRRGDHINSAFCYECTCVPNRYLRGSQRDPTVDMPPGKRSDAERIRYLHAYCNHLEQLFHDMIPDHPRQEEILKKFPQRPIAKRSPQSLESIDLFPKTSPAITHSSSHSLSPNNGGGPSNPITSGIRWRGTNTHPLQRIFLASFLLLCVTICVMEVQFEPTSKFGEESSLMIALKICLQLPFLVFEKVSGILPHFYKEPINPPILNITILQHSGYSSTNLTTVVVSQDVWDVGSEYFLQGDENSVLILPTWSTLFMASRHYGWSPIDLAAHYHKIIATLLNGKERSEWLSLSKSSLFFELILQTEPSLEYSTKKYFDLPLEIFRDDHKKVTCKSDPNLLLPNMTMMSEFLIRNISSEESKCDWFSKGQKIRQSSGDQDFSSRLKIFLEEKRKTK